MGIVGINGVFKSEDLGDVSRPLGLNSLEEEGCQEIQRLEGNSGYRVDIGK